MSATSPARRVIQGEALAWMIANPAEPAMSVVTSLPDVSEQPLPLDAWRAWFIEAVRAVIRFIPDDGVAIFYQSDIRHDGAWIDKGHLVMCGADEERASVIWHKIVCRKPPGTIARGRPGYSHMICVSRAPSKLAIENPGPDVLADAGVMPWSRAMGTAACLVACTFLRDEVHARTIVDPFCGRGTVLAVANAMGLDAVGVDLSAKRCRRARTLMIDEHALRENDDSAKITVGEAFARGASLFDAGRFWDAHEAWERRWRVESDFATKRFFQALIQIAAGFHKLIVSKSDASAVRLFAKGTHKLDAWPADFDLTAFRGEVEACARAIAEGRFEPNMIPRLS